MRKVAGCRFSTKNLLQHISRPQKHGRNDLTRSFIYKPATCNLLPYLLYKTRGYEVAGLKTTCNPTCNLFAAMPGAFRAGSASCHILPKTSRERWVAGRTPTPHGRFLVLTTKTAQTRRGKRRPPVSGRWCVRRRGMRHQQKRPQRVSGAIGRYKTGMVYSGFVGGA